MLIIVFILHLLIFLLCLTSKFSLRKNLCRKKKEKVEELTQQNYES